MDRKKGAKIEERGYPVNMRNSKRGTVAQMMRVRCALELITVMAKMVKDHFILRT